MSYSCVINADYDSYESIICPTPTMLTNGTSGPAKNNRRIY